MQRDESKVFAAVRKSAGRVMWSPGAEAASPGAKPPASRSFLRDNGLTLVCLALFAVFWVLQTVVGFYHHNAEQASHHQQALSYWAYVMSPANLEATMENWESEFLQMALFVWLTSFLFQRGSAESHDPDDPNAGDTKEEPKPDSPRPARKGGWVRALYAHSLSLTLFGMFLVSFGLHAVGGTGDFNQQQIMHGEATITVWQYMSQSRFWFESFQNWQSEFLAVAAIVVLSIYMREEGSSQSKKMDDPHAKTGEG